MATKADICNLALSLLGDSASVTSITPPDGSPQAGNCARWYPLALRQLTEAFDWSFLTKRIRPAALSSLDTTLYKWRYAYNVPSDCVRLIKVETEDGPFCPLREVSFEVEHHDKNSSRLLLCNAETPIVSYVSLSDNPSIYPTYFVQALVPLLASMLVGPLKRTDAASQMATNLLALYQNALTIAKTMDAKNSVHKTRRHLRLPPHMRAREV